VALSVHRFSDSLQPWRKVRLLCSLRVSHGTWNRGESSYYAVHGFSHRLPCCLCDQNPAQALVAEVVREINPVLS
jgi:hypothetical protein